MIDDLLIINCLVKPDVGVSPISSGFIAIRDGKIRQIGAMADFPASSRTMATKVIDAAGSLAIPGLVNGHNHCAMTLFRGLADDLPLTAWLQEHIFPAETKFVDPEMVYWCTQLAAAEMIMSGTTCVADGYFYEDFAAQALKDAGMRGVTAQGVIDFPAPGAPDPGQNLKPPAALLRKWQGDRLITPAVFCHSPYTCAPATLLGAKQLAREHGCRLFIHLAETAWELEELRRRQLPSPVSLLHDLGVLAGDTVCVHSVWVDAVDLRLMAASGASVVTCPESNMKLASGIAPVPAMLAEGIPVALGTDGAASNNDLDLFGEMCSAALLHKVNGRDPTLLSAPTMVRMATAGGAMALGLAKEIGRLAPGMKADLLLVDLSSPHLTPHYDLDSLLVYAVSGADVQTVVVDGVVLMESRQLLTLDLCEIRRQVEKMAVLVRKET